ncbi:hypothetical protein ACIOWF_05110 [Cellulosimicrobium cellulans]|uniref:hypothetical protein n=1 Tax=Cellulosimicrobium cellulans TaxID=1710 RepID=UPI00380AAF0D
MATIAVPLSTVTKHVQTKFGAIILGSDEDHPEVRGYVRTWLGAPLPDTEELDRRLERHGAVWGGDGSQVPEENGDVWVPLYALERPALGMSRAEIIAAAKQHLIDNPPPPVDARTRSLVHALLSA